MCEKSVISEKRGHFGTLKISVFIEIGVVLRLKSAIFSTWRTLMGYTNFRRVGVLGLILVRGEILRNSYQTPCNDPFT